MVTYMYSTVFQEIHSYDIFEIRTFGNSNSVSKINAEECCFSNVQNISNELGHNKTMHVSLQHSWAFAECSVVSK